MKLGFLQLIYIVVISAVVATVSWILSPDGPSEIACEESVLKPGEICLSQLIEGEKTIGWVDARARKKYDEGHIEGAVLLNNDPSENWDEMMAEAMGVLPFGDVVVVYCGKTGCAASEEVAQRLREGPLRDFGIDVLVLYGGEKALVADGRL